jgi:O-antigen ligase
VIAATGRLAPRLPVVAAGLILASLAALSAEVVLGRTPTISVALTLLAGCAAFASWVTFIRWRAVLAVVIVVILFVPIRRYALPGSLPFQLEPYRLLIAIVAVLWLTALLIDQRVRFRRTIVDAPLLMVLVVSTASIAVNADRIASVAMTSTATKALTFLISFALLFYLVASVVRRLEDVDYLLKILVGGATVVAALAVVELFTGFNPFNHLERVFPFLRQTGENTALTRGGRLRVYASAQHPIALGSMFALLVPMAIYLARSTGRRLWLAATAVLMLGTFATVSRTGVLSLLVVAFVYLILRPRETIRVWPLVLPLLAAVHFAMPGLIGTFYYAFFPKGGLVAEQAEGPVGSSRVATLGPGIDQVEQRPLLGLGYGSRVPSGLSDGTDGNFITDDQWLATGMETGILGLFAWIWLFVRFLRKMFRAAGRDATERGWLYTGLAASGTAFAVAMATYDAFSFIQATFVLFILIALGSAALADQREPQT